MCTKDPEIGPPISRLLLSGGWRRPGAVMLEAGSDVDTPTLSNIGAATGVRAAADAALNNSPNVMPEGVVD